MEPRAAHGVSARPALNIGDDLLRSFAAPVPRYTSYPTAPHFHAGVDGRAYENWLRDWPGGEDASAYLHIPFCDTLCWFCGCHTRVLNRRGPLDAYVAALADEIGAVGDRLGDRLGAACRLARVHLGGGSPTMLAPDHLDRLRAALLGSFDLAPGAEIAIEIDPRGLTRQTIAALAAFGVNRASIGVQDFDPAVQRAINRVQSVEETAAAAAALRSHGIGNLNIDLMYGLPHQTVEGIGATLRSVLAIEPDRIAVFGYAHLPHLKKHQALIDRAALPDDAERFRQARHAARLIMAAGYEPVGFDHFAKPGDGLARAARGGELQRNFQGYTDDRAKLLLGFGASAIGMLPGGYVQNHADVRRYIECIAAGGLATQRGIELDDDDRQRRSIIHRLMCDLSADLGGDAAVRYAGELSRCRELVARGLLSISGSRIGVTEFGRPFLRSIAAIFDGRLGGASA